MKTSQTNDAPLGSQYSRRMISIYADLLSKRSLAAILLMAFLIVTIVYIATAFLRNIN